MKTGSLRPGTSATPLAAFPGYLGDSRRKPAPLKGNASDPKTVSFLTFPLTPRKTLRVQPAHVPSYVTATL